MCWRAEGCKGLLEVGVKRSAARWLQTSTREELVSHVFRSMPEERGSRLETLEKRPRSCPTGEKASSS